MGSGEETLLEESATKIVDRTPRALQATEVPGVRFARAARGETVEFRAND